MGALAKKVLGEIRQDVKRHASTAGSYYRERRGIEKQEKEFQLKGVHGPYDRPEHHKKTVSGFVAFSGREKPTVRLAKRKRLY